MVVLIQVHHPLCLKWSFMWVLLFFFRQQLTSRAYACSATYYPSNSKYQSNLNTLVSTLNSKSTINGGFYNATIGQGPDTINGLFLCRGDITPQECQSCLKAANEELIDKLCPNQIGAITWLDVCMFRYTNESIFSKLEERPGNELVSPEQSSDPVAFNRTLGDLMDELIDKAISGSDLLPMFARGDVKFSNFERIYGLVQCTPDLSRSDCNKCLRDCVEMIPGCCSGRRGAVILMPSCSVRFEPSQFYDQFRNSSTTTTNDRVPNGSGKSSSGSSNRIIAVVIPTVIGVIFLIAILVYLLMFKKTKKSAKMNSVDQEIGNVESLQFGFGKIKVATNNFSPANKLGEGGFGAVYKGTLVDGQEIAVKRLFLNSGQGSQEFKNEVVLLHKLQHRNLVRLLGFCLEGGEKLLIYEFVPNRSLDKYYLILREKRIWIGKVDIRL